MHFYLELRRHAVVSLFSLYALTCGVMLGQETSQAEHEKDLAASVATIQKVINTVRPALFGGLTGSEAKVYKEITFRVSDREAHALAGSVMEDGTRIVEIDEGYGREIEMLAEAMLIEQAQNRPVLVPYIRYVALSWSRHATFIKEPGAFAHFDFDTILDKPEGAKEWDKMITDSIAFVVAHEVGHHVLGHIDKPVTDLEKRRQRELDADSWAIECLKHATPHFSPISGYIPLIFDYYITPTPIAHEANSDHPADLRRIHAMFEAMEDALPSYRADLAGCGKRLGSRDIPRLSRL
jgi:hypothetical protein